jgi:hypothetical protein
VTKRTNNALSETRQPSLCGALLLICAVLLVGFSQPLWAIPTLKLDETIQGPIALQDFLEYHQTGIADPNIEEIKTLDDFLWQPTHHLPIQIAMALRQTIWFRMQLDNTIDKPQALTINNTNPAADWTEMYMVTTNHSTIEQPTTTKIEKITNNNTTLHFQVDANSSQTLYIVIRGFHANTTPLSLYSSKEYERFHQTQQWYFGLIDGAIFGLLIYNVLLWRKTRQTMYFAYTLLGFFNVLTISAHQHLLSLFFPTLSPEWNTTLSLALPLNISVSLAFLFQHFFETKQHNPRTHIFLNGYMAWTLVVVAMALLRVPLIITTPLFVIPAGLSILLMFRIAHQKKSSHKTANYLFMAGLCMPLLSAVMTTIAASGKGVIGQHYMSVMQLTDVLEMFFLSAAMAYKVSQLQAEHNKQLEKTNEELITNAAHSRLLAHLNHEFRTPLNGILGAAELLISKSEKNNRKTVNMIYQTALPLKILIDDLININALSANKKQIITARFDLEQLLQECSEIFKLAASKQNVRLYFTIDSTALTDVKGDPHRLRQILLNLLGNAFKFTHNGVVGIHVMRSMEPNQTGSLYRFEVYNSGDSIPEDIQAKLFQRFEKGNNPDEIHSSGLGLSIVKELSEMLGGSCGYSPPTFSAVSGNLFWFNVVLDSYLPIKRSSHSLFEHRRILIADENPQFAYQLGKSLGDKYSLLEIAHDRNQLEKLAHSTFFDIAIVQQALLEDGHGVTSQDHFLLEDIAAVCTYIEDNSTVHKTSEIYPVIIRPQSMRKFCFTLAKTLATLNRTIKNPAAIKNASTLTRILIAEDNPTSQIIIGEILKRFPLSVDICNNGKEAELAYEKMLLANTPYKAIFMDCEMPIQDGFETTRNIRQFELSHNLRPVFITAVTAHNELIYKTKSRDAGMDDFLSKPISIESISQFLQKWGLTS